MHLPPIARPAADTGPVPQPPRPVREHIPHTTHEKAELYLVIAPPLDALADELMQLNLKTTGLTAEPQVVEQAAGLLQHARILLRGEPGVWLADLDFAPPVRVQALALGLRQLSRAVAGFRDRYYGYNPLTDGPAWAVADPLRDPDPRWLGRPGSVARAIDELNLMTSEVMRSHLVNLADRNHTPLPADPKRREELESSEKRRAWPTPNVAGGDRLERGSPRSGSKVRPAGLLSSQAASTRQAGPCDGTRQRPSSRSRGGRPSLSETSGR